MSELLPCPFCGHVTFTQGSRVIECQRCYACGPVALDKKDSQYLWNRRIDPTNAAEPREK